jgi:hypothetical protein
MEPGPIFIGGPDRCGKTTLRAFLVSHPNLSIPAVGSNMWTYFYGQYGDLAVVNNFERCLEAMLHYKHVRFLNPDPDRIRREFKKGPPTYARLFALFQEHHAEREGKPRWGDQTGYIERYADPIFAAYPTAKMIHMIRDPRDRYDASLALWPKGKGRVGGATARWLYSVRLAIHNQNKYPGRYKILRFETLIERTEQTLREICAFLDEKYVPEMLMMVGALDHRSKLTKGYASKPGVSPLSGNFIGQYRQTLPKREIAFMQAIIGQQMAEFGYTSDPIRFSVVDHLLYTLVVSPVNRMRMVSWLTLETIQHNYPYRFGRKLSADRIVKDQGEKHVKIETT